MFMMLETAVTKYLGSSNPARGTRKQYRTTLKKWELWGGGVAIESLGCKEIREFLAGMPDEAVVANTGLWMRADVGKWLANHGYPLDILTWEEKDRVLLRTQANAVDGDVVIGESDLEESIEMLYSGRLTEYREKSIEGIILMLCGVPLAEHQEKSNANA